MNDIMDKGLINSPFSSIVQYTSFTEHFSARINFSSMYNLLSFFIPSRYIFRFDRVIEHKMDTRADTLNIGCSLGFSSINMFGALGYMPLFSFLQSDEYSHAIDAVFSIPKDGEYQWRIQSVMNTNFRGFSGGVLNFKNQLTLRYNGHWVESFTAAWEAPTKKSLTSMLYDWIASAALEQSTWLIFSPLFRTGYKQFRRESLELMFDKSGDYLRWSITAGHEEIVRILGRLNFTTFIKLRLGEDLNRQLFTFDSLLGISFRISF
jgi:hypothetical protein